jgi:hypothetical protein
LSTNCPLHVRECGGSKKFVQKWQRLITVFNAWKGGCTWILLLLEVH